ncbi:MAG: DUF2804 domain-containing protein [Promethearchaeota archaeon]
MQAEMETPTDLLDDDGKLVQTGWAKQLLLNYNREKLGVGLTRLKEWDCYVVLNPEFALSLIIADVGYFGMATVEFIDFQSGREHAGIALRLLTRGKLNLPRTANRGDVEFRRGKKWVKFEVVDRGREGKERVLSFDFPRFKFDGHRGISGRVALHQPADLDTMVNVIPFRNPKHFVYVQKITCMPATGHVDVGGRRREFRGSENGSWGTLDWSRGVFPYRTEWWWAYASGRVGGVPLGFNVDYGFGTESSKCMLFHDGRGHHLDEVTYTWDGDDLGKPWVFTSNDGRVDLRLEPVHTQELSLNALVLSTKGCHAYGFYTGEVVLDDGTRVEIKRSDRLFGSAEHFRHRW